MAALHEARRSGEGQLVDVSMADGALSWLAMVAGAYLCDGEVPGRGDGQLTGRFVCYLPYEAADGYITMGALEPQFWARFCAGVGREDLVAKQFERTGSEAWDEIAEIFRSKTRAEWKAFNDEHDAMIEPVLDVDEALDSELVREREMVVEWEQPRARPGAPARRAGEALAHPGDRARAGARRSASTRRRCCATRGFSAEEIAELLSPAPPRGRPPRRRPRRGSWDERARRRSCLKISRACGARRRPGRHRPPLPARGAAARAGQDLAQHGLLPARVRRADPADQAAAGAAVHAAAGDPELLDSANGDLERLSAFAESGDAARRARARPGRSGPRRQRSSSGSRSPSGRSAG